VYGPIKGYPNNIVIFCARQGIGIRGHNEQDHSLLNNRGNFLELLHLRAKDNDTIKQYFIDKKEAFDMCIQNSKTFFYR